MSRSVIIAGARTPIARMSGAFASLTAMDLGGFAIMAALKRAGVEAGIPMTIPCTTVNKVCLSGLNTIYLADQMIRAGDADIVVAGGMESMTNTPYLLPGARAGYRMGDQKVVDAMMFDGLWDAFNDVAMGTGTDRD